MATRFFPNYNINHITSRFGNRTMNGVTRHHNGIDLVAKTKDGKHKTDYITAHTGGTVEENGYNNSCGNFVSIRVSKTVVMVYYHLKNRSSLKEGETVKKGEKIGYMGNTGASTGAHLHFGIKDSGKWVNPEPYLDKDYPLENAKSAEIRKPYTLDMNSLRKGCTGDDVEALQALLVSHGYSCGNDGVGGVFGADTEKAVKSYQADCEIMVDGVAGKATMSRLLGVK